MRIRSGVAVLAIGPALWLSAFATGCAGVPAPKDRIASAETLVRRAEQEGAGQYAPRPLREAKDKIERARAEIDDDDNATALRLAEEAEADAKLAAVEAVRGKTAENVKELTRTLQSMENEIRGTPGAPLRTTPLPLSDPLTTPEVK
jgi:hypothetical protein